MEQAKLAEALAKAQVEFKPALKETKGQVGNQKYQYADLATINDATKAALAKNGLCVTSKTLMRDGNMLVETSLIHVSGERETSVWPLVTGRPQEMGSALTYARRYTICALLNVVGETDDDGAAANDAAPPKIQQPEEPRPFEIINAWGETSTFARGGEYLAAIEEAFKDAPDKGGFWESNQKHFAEWQTKFRGKPAGKEFNRVGQMIADALGSAAA
jgi:hypothetical protein